MKINTTVTLTDKDVREILADFLQRSFPACKAEDLVFDTSRGDNGEFGGKPTPDRVTVRWHA
jgi:hypothetical protein